MRRPVNYDALRQAEQQASDVARAPSQSEAAAQLDSAQPEATRPANHPGRQARYNDGGAPEDVKRGQVVPPPQELGTDPAETARAARVREDEIAQAKEQNKGQGR